MKTNLVLAILIFAAGTGGLCALRNAAATSEKIGVAAGEADAAESQRLSQARIEYTELTERIRELKEKLSATTASGGGAIGPEGTQVSIGSRHPSADQAERLLAELGFNWNSIGDYLVVSKDILHSLRLEGMKKDRLSDTACQVLAITPAERVAIEARTQQVAENFKAWAAAHVQRAEPEGDVVANYTLQFDDAFGGSLSNAFSSEVFGVLGPERGELFLEYASSWMTDLGLYGGQPTTMTVKRYQAGDQTRLGLELKRYGGTMSTDVGPWQSFPEAFLPLFPGGWPDLAKREGFELPKEFKKDGGKTSNIEH